MNLSLTANWKRAQELVAERTKIDDSLTSLQEELRHLSAAVNQKIVAKEKVIADLARIQEDTARLVSSGEWVLKDPISTGVLTGVATGGQVVIMSKTLNENPVWNFVKRISLNVWNFFFNRPKVVKPSVTLESAPVSPTKVS